MSQGPDHIDDAELLAIILGTGMRGTPVVALAGHLLLHFGGIVGLARASPQELAEVAGIGPAQATRMVAAIAFGTRALARSRRRIGELGCPADVRDRMWPRFIGVDQEVFFVLAIDARNIVVSEHEIGRGHLNGIEIHPREVFIPLISSRAAAGVCVHNHPSGDPEPSHEDIQLAYRLKEAGDLLGIPIVDHIILAESGYVSVAEWLLGHSVDLLDPEASDPGPDPDD